jgi:cobaltochelatase CobS
MSNSTVRQTIATPVAELFGIEAPLKVTAEKFADDTNVHIPKIDEHYVFRKEFVREVLAYIQRPHNDAMLAFGHTGTGKSCKRQ